METGRKSMGVGCGEGKDGKGANEEDVGDLHVEDDAKGRGI